MIFRVGILMCHAKTTAWNLILDDNTFVIKTVIDFSEISSVDLSITASKLY